MTGCGDDNAMMSQERSLVARTVPASGEAAFDPVTNIYIRFNEPMDTSRFQESFFFMDATLHDAMHDSLGGGMMSDSAMAVCGSMAHGMNGGATVQTRGMADGRHGDMGVGLPGIDTGCSMMMSTMEDDHHLADTAAFYRRMHDRGVRGRFQWNDLGDSCAFMPDSVLMGNRDYVIMVQSMAPKMHGRRDGGMMRSEPEDLMIRFHTR